MITKSYDKQKYPFSKIISNLFEISNLENVHELYWEVSEGEKLDQTNEADTPFHKKYYNKLKEGWPELTKIFNYFIEEEISKTIKGPFLYQTMPSFRVQVPKQKAVSNWHYDADYKHGHPDWEINIQIALTEAKNTSATWVESVPGLGNYTPINLNDDQYCIFNGNRCVHGNFLNQTNKSRVSYDFRIIPCFLYDIEGNAIFRTYEGEELINYQEEINSSKFVGKLNSKNSFYGKKWIPKEYYSFFDPRKNNEL